MHKAGARLHAFCAPRVAANVPLIFTEKTLLMLGVVSKMHLITVISSRHLPYLYTQDGVSPGISPNHMTSPSPCIICLHSLLLVSQSAFSIRSPNQHSESDKAMPPTECINCNTCHVPFILTLTIRQTTATPNHLLHQCQSVHPPAVSV